MLRCDLAEEALFLGRLVTELLPREPEALGLLALMLHAEARRVPAHAQGEYVPLAEQDTSLWDPQMIDAAESLLLRASTMGDIGRYQLEGALQSAHVHRRRTGHSNWPAVVQLYDVLLTLSGSPVVAINRALAVAESVPAPLSRRWKRRGRSAAHRIPALLGRTRGTSGQSGQATKRATRTKSPSVSNATPRSAASCNGASRP